MSIKVGTAGWTIPRQNVGEFPSEGSSLERYSARLSAIEINSSFYRPHRISTWQRWSDAVPATFRFSVKLSKRITHEAKLRNCSSLLGKLVEQVEVLGDKLGVLLVQLPPKLEFDPAVARSFFAELTARSPARLACEPRNPTWFTPEAESPLREHRVARVAADPAICAEAAVPGGWPGLRYWRLHGSPRLYRSNYADRIGSYAEVLSKFAAEASDTWCIFDNTASSAAMGDALCLAQVLREEN